MAAKGLSDERAARLMVALREGRTPKCLNVKPPQLQAYFDTHHDYAREARPLIEANAKAARHRKGRENPDFDRFVSAAIADRHAVGMRIHFQRKRNAAKKEEANDYFRIRAMLPPGFPDKDDVVSDIFEAMLNGSLKREYVRARVQTYITAHNRMFPTKYCKFGNSPLVSFDEVLFEDGSMTRGDTVTRGLWGRQWLKAHARRLRR